MSSYTTSVTEYSCWDRKERSHVIYQDANTTEPAFLVRVNERSLGLYGETWSGGKVLNLGCPAHTVEEAQRLAKVFWMERLEWDFSRTLLARPVSV